jgi:hypothetical protein
VIADAHLRLRRAARPFRDDRGLTVSLSIAEGERPHGDQAQYRDEHKG